MSETNRDFAQKQIWTVPALYGAGGLIAAIVIFFVPIVFIRRAAWIIDSTVHEMGHTVMAWFLGAPALPRISFIAGKGGNAATQILHTILPLQLIIWGCLAVLAAWAVRGAWRGGFRWGVPVVAVAVVIVYPLLAFEDSAREVAT